MHYQALALDLDGTTLTSDHTIQPAISEAIRRISQQATVLLVTGRHHTAAHPFHHQLGLDTPVISCNGTYVYDYARRQILACDAVPREEATRFIELARAHHLNIVMYLNDCMVYPAGTPVRYMEAMGRWASQFPDAIRPQIKPVASLEQALARSSHVWKFVVEGEMAEVSELASHPWIKQHFCAEQSWRNRMDFARAGNSKGARLAELLTQLDISPARVVAIGDNHNDISMLTLAGLGVAMANSDEPVRRAAQHITAEDHNGRGILDTLTRCFAI